MQALIAEEAAERVLVCQDARMNEVYWGCFHRFQDVCSLIGTEAVAGAVRVRLPSEWKALDVIGAGSGFDAYTDDLAPVSQEFSALHPQMLPRAREIAQLAAAIGCGGAVAAEDAHPVYLRDEVVSLPNQVVRLERS
jgi:tRNA threonylcarbamoyladenosine biosynthesis protein TsaB